MTLDNYGCVVRSDLDLLAAFGTIIYSILLDLHSSRLGLPGIVVDVISSYPSNSIQCLLMELNLILYIYSMVSRTNQYLKPLYLQNILCRSPNLFILMD